MSGDDMRTELSDDVEAMMGEVAHPELDCSVESGNNDQPHAVQKEENSADVTSNVNKTISNEINVNNVVEVVDDTHHMESDSFKPTPTTNEIVDDTPHLDETSVAISDISGSTPPQPSEAHVKEGWTEATTFEPRRSFTISDCGRENVDRLLNTATASSVGGSEIGSRSCMEVDVDQPYSYTYTDAFYRSGDWLRFVPRRSDVPSSQSGPSEMSQDGLSQDPSAHELGPAGLNPDRYYRGFDNTAIRTHSRRVDQNALSRRNFHKQEFSCTGPRYQNSITERIDEENDLRDWETGMSIPNQNLANLPMEISMRADLTLEVSPGDFPHNGMEEGEEYAATTQNQAQGRQPETGRTSLHEGDMRRSASQASPRQYDTSSSREDQMHLASWDSKYESYACRVDHSQEDSSVEIAIFSAARPHMRAFHYAWLSFFFTFLAWFAATPLLHEIQTSLDLSKEEIWASSICSVAGAVVTRCLSGLFCDIYGARLISAAVLLICGFPTMFTGLVNTATGLSVLRLITGIGGSAFVTCQYWTSTMFTREVSGTANALAAGWGNLGGGIAQLFVGTMLFPLFKQVYSRSVSEERAATLAWRSCCIIPGLLCTCFSFFVIRYADDSPKGNYHKRKKLGLMQKHSAWQHIKSAVSDYNTCLLVLMYGCCFGVELTTTNAAALYFYEEFRLSTESAAAVAFTFGGMNLFARGLGGFLSDVSNAYWGMRGRLIWQLVCFALEGAFIMVFSKANSLAGSITALMTFSIFVQGAEGSTFGIVPYLNPRLTGTVAGIIGAGGNAGAVVFSIAFQKLPYREAFFWMGASTTCVSILSSLVWIKGYEGIFFKRRVLPSPPKDATRNPSITHVTTEADQKVNS